MPYTWLAQRGRSSHTAIEQFAKCSIKDGKAGEQANLASPCRPTAETASGVVLRDVCFGLVQYDVLTHAIPFHPKGGLAKPGS